jgi:uncharacterized protein (TIGR01319 family)
MSAPEVILATDCGSTTTKAILIEKIGDEYRQTIRGEAPTTVEAPFDDVTIGVINAATEVQELTHERKDGGKARKIVDDDGNIIIREKPGEGDGIDLYLSTSSAGGGLQMAVGGVVKTMTAKSAQAAALSAGAIVIDTLSVDDDRKPHERIARLRAIRPDIVLLAGGTDGGTVRHVVELAETVRDADPRPRFGRTLKLPFIFAGNVEARKEIKNILGETTAYQEVPNIRPTLESENTQPSRDAIHDVFLEHVMSHAPGYDKLMHWVSEEIMSTPNAVGYIIKRVSESRKNMQVLAVDIGGATTDVFSVFERTDISDETKTDMVFNRTVSANLGMSYSICNVLLEAGIEDILRWMPFEIDEAEVKNRMRNKMIRPTTIPQTIEDLLVEHAVAREALTHAFIHHKDLVRGLQGVSSGGGGSIETFSKGGQVSGQSLIDMNRLEMIIGSGGVLSHAPSRKQSALIMMDAYQPEGFTYLTVDSIFMMPQLGVLSNVMPEAATQVFERDCIIYLGTVVAPSGQIPRKPEGKPVMDVRLTWPDGRKDEFTMHWGEIKVLPCAEDQEVDCWVRPHKPFNMGDGPGKELRKKIRGGVVGLIFDSRGRPLALSPDPDYRIPMMRAALDAFDLPYPGKEAK